MKKLAVMSLSLFLVLSQSLANTTSVGKDLVSRKRFGSKTPTLTKNAVARAVPRTQRRLLITNDLTDTDDGPPGPNELDLHCAWRRPELAKLTINNDSDDQELSDYVKTRLLIARARALQKYQETWG